MAVSIFQNKASHPSAEDRVDAGKESSPAHIVDRRQAAAQLEAYGIMAQNSPNTRQLKSLQAMMSGSDSVKQLTSVQAMADARKSSAAPIQRKTYLANEDQNIYKDDSIAEELTYLGDMGDSPKLPLFMDYALYQKLADQLTNIFKEAFTNEHSGIPKKVREGKSGPDTKVWWEALAGFSRKYVEQTFSSNDLSSFLKAVGKVYYEGTDGKLKELPVTDHLVMLQSRFTGALANGPLYRNVGGGSRNPPAEGTLFTENRTINHEGVLRTIGVEEADFGKYDKVKIVYVEDYEKAKPEVLNKGGHVWESSFVKLLYASTASLTRSKNARFTAAGQSYSEDFSELNLDDEDRKRVETSFKSLGTPSNKGWQSGTALGKTDRGAGQAKAMSNWNALGVAAYSNAILGTGYSLDQNWEWLHVQGAQIGGVTDSTNLVAGTFSTNSEMIPLENRIAKWADTGATAMKARFISDKSKGVLSPGIRIEVMAEEHPDLGTISDSDPLQVDFNAHSGAVADKLTVRLQEKDQRGKIEQRQPPEGIVEDEEYVDNNHVGPTNETMEYEDHDLDDEFFESENDTNMKY